MSEETTQEMSFDDQLSAKYIAGFELGRDGAVRTLEAIAKAMDSDELRGVAATLRIEWFIK